MGIKKRKTQGTAQEGLMQSDAQPVEQVSAKVTAEDTIQVLSHHIERMYAQLVEKNNLVVSLQKTIAESSEYSMVLLSELQSTRVYFNQIWREYSSMRKKYNQLRNSWLVRWMVKKNRYLSSGERELARLANKSRESGMSDGSKHYQEINSESGVYSGSPHTVILDVTALCNLRCIMCFQSAMKKQDFVYGELSNLSIQNSAQFIVRAEEVKLFATGEPFLSSSLRGIIDALYGNVKEIIVSTNGTIYDENAKYITGRLTKITISIDSANAANFEKIRVNSRFVNIVENIRRMRRDYPNLYMTFAVTVARYNLAECPDIVRLAADLKINHVQYSRMIALEVGVENEDLRFEEQEHIERVGQKVKDVAKDLDISIEWAV